MRKVSLLLSMLLVFGLMAAHAQGGGQRGGQRGQGGQRMAPEAMAKQRAELWQEKFGLSDDQYKKTYDLLLANQKEVREKMQSLMQSGDRSGMRAAMEKNQEELDKKLKDVFTAEQWTKYEAWKKENPPMQRGRGGRN
ncbi:hypothetical protein [Roseivirga sp.]|uniref:hypothetical protein n=1 Tax=Roseivirga sp. TaxID=1964215 RepID=UPI003B51F173